MTDTIKSAPLSTKIRLLAAAGLILLSSSSVWADSTPANPTALLRDPWEKFSITLGAFLSASDTGVRVGSGLGADLDVEEALGLDASNTVFRLESFWRFTRNRRHRLDASWFALRRSANRTLGEDFNMKDQDGNLVTVKAGAKVESHFDLNIIETAYSYSFVQEDRLDLALIGGVYIMPIDFGLNATGVTNATGNLNFTAPLPVAGLRVDVALTPKWFIRTGTQFFYIEYENFKGSLTQLHGALEVLPFRHVGVGIGVDHMRFGFEGSEEDYPNVDLKGKVEFEYTGLQLYGKLFF